MSNKARAADQLIKFGKLLGEVISVADDLQRLGSIEAAENDARAKLAQVQGQVAEAEQAVEAANQKLAEVEQAVEAGRTEVQRLTNVAKEQAQAITDEAALTANNLAKEAAQNVQFYRNQAEEVRATISTLENQRLALESEISALQARVEQVREQARKIVEG